MRRISAMLLVGSVFLTSGCKSWMNRSGSANETAPINESAPPPTVKQMVDYLNLCSSRLNSVQSGSLDMDCKANGQSVGLRASMVCEKPRNFRLRGGTIGISQCDIGSNNEEFWYWIKQDNPPLLYHCSYDAMAKGTVRLPFPFQPDMITAALGMAEYDPNPDKYELKVLPKTLELSENAVSAQGQQVRKVTVFARGIVEPGKGRPQVIEYILRDAQGHDVCKASVEKVVVDGGAIVPQKVRLSWPAQKMELALTLNTIQINKVDAQLARVAFSRADLPYQPFDLARSAPDGGATSIQRVRGAMR
jgi:hypothetical protein